MRALVYVLAWLGCSVLMLATVVELATIGLFVVALGPFACLYVGARLGTWAGLGSLVTGALMVAGLWLFASIRQPLHRAVRRRWQRGLRVLRLVATVRNGLWAQYRKRRQDEVPS